MTWIPSLVFTIDDVVTIAVLILISALIIMILLCQLLMRAGRYVAPPTYEGEPISEVPTTKNEDDVPGDWRLVLPEPIDPNGYPELSFTAYNQECRRFSAATGQHPDSFPYTYSEWVTATLDAYQNRLDAKSIRE